MTAPTELIAIRAVGEKTVQPLVQLALRRVHETPARLLEQGRDPSEPARDHRRLLAESLDDDERRPVSAAHLRRREMPTWKFTDG